MTRKQRDAEIDKMVEKIRTTKGGPDQGAVNLMAVIRFGQVNQAVYDRVGTALPIPLLSTKRTGGSLADPISLEWSNDDGWFQVTILPDLTTLFERDNPGVLVAHPEVWLVPHNRGVPSRFANMIMTQIGKFSDD
jgi:hypothetical protein